MNSAKQAAARRNSLLLTAAACSADRRCGIPATAIHPAKFNPAQKAAG
ncbi:MAG TPA: hypothetical protein PKD17_09155 [Cellvibrionaceae bacterium]|nr:hypothetical protein [Cellvibrionaceae bacterium]HMY40186.1 hypothetical protein [Marinagarivorans sp.]HNG58382.1 hypothetical protein [Cellvibrionaceae bacterium]